MIAALTEDEVFAEVDARRRISDILGDAASRRRARERLGLSIADVAEVTGLSPFSVWRRETEAWRFKRGSLESEGGYRYVRLIARAKGIELP